MGANRIDGGDCEWNHRRDGREKFISFDCDDPGHLITIEFEFLRSAGGLLILPLVIKLIGNDGREPFYCYRIFRSLRKPFDPELLKNVQVTKSTSFCIYVFKKYFTAPAKTTL